MKKNISVLITLLVVVMFLLTSNVYAASLDTIKVEIDKTTIRPGEQTQITINFGSKLGAYTFDIDYDNNIFEYVSVEGGTANDTSDKVRVVFHDSTGGTNARENMSIIFKAKEDITTSNPTEFSITGEGLANSDASVTYDDITVPMVKNVTVEPEYQDYVIDLKHEGDITAGQEKDMTLKYSSPMGKYYEHARLIAEATTPSGASVKLTGKNTDTQVEQDIVQSGWGDPQGYKIGGKDVSQVLNVKGLFSDKGEYSINLKLIDRDNSDAIISQKEFKFTVLENQTKPDTGTPDAGKPETDAPNTQNPEIQKPETEKPDIQNSNTEKPTSLPKTGVNLYVTIAVMILCLTSIAIYYNKVNKR